MTSGTGPSRAGPLTLHEVERAIVDCRRCPRLVSWRETASRRAPRAFRAEEYWGRPVSGFGDPAARVYVLGLAPSAHGGNRTGRAFTGSPTADWLVAALFRADLANQATSIHRADGLVLRGVWMGSAVRCAPPENRPTPQERDTCLPYLAAEIEALTELRVLLVLGWYAWDAALRLLGQRPFPCFAHGAEHRPPRGLTLLASYHPSRQNTNTGRLTAPMLDAVVKRAKQAAGLPLLETEPARCGLRGTGSA